MKVVIISEPKAGTYLCGALLKAFGLKDNLTHVFELGYTRFSSAELETCRKNPRPFSHWFDTGVDLESFISKLPNNSYVTTHLDPNIVARQAFEGCKKIILTRPYKERMRSNIQWTKESGRLYYDIDSQVKEWLNISNTFHLPFHSMINKDTDKLDELQEFLFGIARVDSERAIMTALAEKTLTKSSHRPGDVW